MKVELEVKCFMVMYYDDLENSFMEESGKLSLEECKEIVKQLRGTDSFEYIIVAVLDE